MNYREVKEIIPFFMNSVELNKVNSYPKVAFCNAITPTNEEHYKHLKQANVKVASICLHVSGQNHYKEATLHTNMARQFGMVTHAYMITDLLDPIADVTSFTKRFDQLGYTSGSKMTIWINGDKNVNDREEKICKMIDYLSNYHPRQNIDVAFFQKDLRAGIYDLKKLPQMLNLTVINLNVMMYEIATTGTWIYTDNFCDNSQLLGYDYYGYYTEEGYQLSLVDTEYVVQRGDNWHSISKRHGIPMQDLLLMNHASVNEAVYAGQVVKIA